MLSNTFETSITETVRVDGSSLADLSSLTVDDTFGFYFDNSISYDFILSKLSNSDSLNFVDYSSYTGLPISICSLADFVYTVYDGDYTHVYHTNSIELIKYNSNDFVFVLNIANERHFIWSSITLSTPFGDFVQGWNIDFNTINYSITPIFDNCSEFVVASADNELIDNYISFFDDISSFISYTSYYSDVIYVNNNIFNFVVKQEIDNDVYYMSFFDVSMFNTDNTFKKFQLSFLRNTFENLFTLLQFENNVVSSFIITSFTWFIQLMLLHVVVDTLAFIFKIYHKLLDKVV